MTALFQVRNGLSMEMTSRVQAIQALAQNSQAVWGALHQRMSALVSELTAHLHESAFLSIDAMQCEISSHLLRFNKAALGNKRAMDAFITNISKLNIKLEKKISRELQAALEDWSCLVAKHKIQNLADEICQPGFMRHVEFIPTVLRLQRRQQEFAAQVLQGITASLLLPSAIHTVKQAQQ